MQRRREGAALKKEAAMSQLKKEEPGTLENLSRLAARGFVIAGGLFWMAAAFAGPYAFHDMSVRESLAEAAWPLAATVVILLVGWRYERLAAILLGASTAAVVVWGVLFGWETGVWILMSFVLIAPMVIAGVLFLIAAGAESRRMRPAEAPATEAERQRIRIARSGARKPQPAAR